VIPDSCHSNFLPFYHHPPHAFLLWRSLFSPPEWSPKLPCLSQVGFRFWASPFPSRLANASGRIVFIMVLFMDWQFASGCSPPRPLGRRSYLRLRTASALSGEDFHPTVGEHSQAHEGGPSRAAKSRAARPKNIAGGLLLLRFVAPHNAMGPRRVSAVRDGPPYLTRFGGQQLSCNYQTQFSRHRLVAHQPRILGRRRLERHQTGSTQGTGLLSSNYG